jgi:hypothetical protein
MIVKIPNALMDPKRGSALIFGGLILATLIVLHSWHQGADMERALRVTNSEPFAEPGCLAPAIRSTASRTWLQVPKQPYLTELARADEGIPEFYSLVAATRPYYARKGTPNYSVAAKHYHTVERARPAKRPAKKVARPAVEVLSASGAARARALGRKIRVVKYRNPYWPEHPFTSDSDPADPAAPSSSMDDGSGLGFPIKDDEYAELFKSSFADRTISGAGR